MSIKWYSYPGAGALPMMAYTGGGGGGAPPKGGEEKLRGIKRC